MNVEINAHDLFNDFFRCADTVKSLKIMESFSQYNSEIWYETRAKEKYQVFLDEGKVLFRSCSTNYGSIRSLQKFTLRLDFYRPNKFVISNFENNLNKKTHLYLFKNKIVSGISTGTKKSAIDFIDGTGEHFFNDDIKHGILCCHIKNKESDMGVQTEIKNAVSKSITSVKDATVDATKIQAQIKLGQIVTKQIKKQIISKFGFFEKKAVKKLLNSPLFDYALSVFAKVIADNYCNNNKVSMIANGMILNSTGDVIDMMNVDKLVDDFIDKADIGKLLDSIKDS